MTSLDGARDPASRASRFLVDAALPTLLVAVGAATVVALALGGGSLGLVVAPVAVTALVYVAWRIPLRWSAAALTFLLLALDNTYDAQRTWHSPAAFLGDLLRNNLDWVYPGIGIKLSGLEILLLLLFVIAVARRATGATLDTEGQVQTARPVGVFTLLYLATLSFAAMHGLATGGSADVAIVQVRPLLHVPLLLFLFHLAWRGPRDHRLLGRIVVAAACTKALMALWIRYRVEPRLGYRLHFVTNHGDSILFAIAFAMVLFHWLERPDRKRLQRCALFLPLIALGMHANNRRLAWVSLAMALLAAWLVAPWRGWKRTLTRAAVLALPVAALYVVVGWDAEGRLFKPLRMLQTVADSKVDRSTLYRDVENWNLAVSIQEAPLVGVGFGKQYTEHMDYGKNLQISTIFSLYRAEPHNALLGLILFAGLIGFSGMWTLFAVGVYFAVRSFRFAVKPDDRAAALTCLGALVVISVQFYGDLGQYFSHFRVFAALALVVGGKLAVATGAWPAARRRARLRSAPGGEPPALAS